MRVTCVYVRDTYSRLRQQLESSDGASFSIVIYTHQINYYTTPTCPPMTNEMYLYSINWGPPFQLRNTIRVFAAKLATIVCPAPTPYVCAFAFVSAPATMVTTRAGRRDNKGKASAVKGTGGFHAHTKRANGSGYIMTKSARVTPHGRRALDHNNEQVREAISTMVGEPSRGHPVEIRLRVPYVKLTNDEVSFEHRVVHTRFSHM